MRQRNSQFAFTPIGFTLAELLIALAILGVIATFTIPKILDSGSNSKKNAIAKEVIAMISEAFTLHKLNNTITASTSKAEITPYLNYVKIDSTTTVDSNPLSGGTFSCSNVSHLCLVLHSGAILFFEDGSTFADTASTSAWAFHIDTEPAVNPGGDSLRFFLYANGRVTTRNNVLPNTYAGGSSHNPVSNGEPSWFSWSN